MTDEWVNQAARELGVSPWPWHTIYGETLMNMLRKVEAGESPEKVYQEACDNAEQRENYA